MVKSTHTPEYRQLRQLLKQMRIAAKLSQRDLGARLRVRHSWVSDAETGERRIDLVEFAWWCLACDQNPATVASPLLAQARLRSR